VTSDRTAARHLSFLVAYNSEDSYTPTPATLRYRRSDPFVVSLDFGPGNVWEFALETLRDGLVSPAGQGDVRIASVAGCVSVTLKSPDGIIVLLAARQAVEELLADVKRAGPGELDIDGCVERILRGAR
jgi:hypothetical protein